MTVSRVVDEMYPGTSVERMLASRERVKSLHDELNADWESVRGKLLWAAGLRDLKSARPGTQSSVDVGVKISPHSQNDCCLSGMGYTGHAFNDCNHCDATTMLGEGKLAKRS